MRLQNVIRNELDALLIILAIEFRMWTRSLQLDVSDLISRWNQRLRTSGVSVGLSNLFFDGLLFLIQPHRRGEDREQSLTINFREDQLSLRGRLRLIELGEVVEVAERLALFTDGPRVDEQRDEAGNLRRALRHGVQLSTGVNERCIVRLPSLRRRYFQDALQTLLTGAFLPTTEIATSGGAAAESRWIQIIVEQLLPDDDLSDRGLSLPDRIKRAARDQWREFSEMNGFGDRSLAVLSGQAQLAAFLENDKPGLIVLGTGGAGKTTLIRQIVQENLDARRTVLIFPLRNRHEARSVPGLLGALLGVTRTDGTELLVSVARAFAERQEELIIVLEGLNELANADNTHAILSSFLESASTLSANASGQVRSGMRLILTSRPETYFRARSKSDIEPSALALHQVMQTSEREPKSYLELHPLNQAEREKLFSIYFEESSESGAEQAITRATRQDPQFATLLSSPIMIKLASELYRKGVPIRALRSSSDLVDVIIDQGFERLPEEQRGQQAWNALERILEQRLRLVESDVVKFDDLWADAPKQRDSILLALSDLSEMGVLQPFLGHAQGTVAFVHDRIEENILGRYLSKLDDGRPLTGGNATWHPHALEACLILGEGKTVYEEALGYYLRDAFLKHLFNPNNSSYVLATRWTQLVEAAARIGRLDDLARILALSMVSMCSGSRGNDLPESWLVHLINGLSGQRGKGSPLVIEAIINRLIDGIEALLADQVTDLERLAKELRSAVRGYFDNPMVELRCAQILAECHIQAEDWKGALSHLRKVQKLLDVVNDEATVERFRRAKGIALRSTGRIREAANELEAVLTSQLQRDIRRAVVTLPNVVETMREFGNFAGGLKLIDDVERSAGGGLPPHDRLRLALWRGILNKNLMQDAIQFRWNASKGAFVSARVEAESYRQDAEDALERSLDISVTIGAEGHLLPDMVQVYSELAELALWHAMIEPQALKQADLWLDELARVLALRPAVEPQVEYHRYCAQRAALDRRFKDAHASLERARQLALKHEMKFIEADCDLDWARFIANDARFFKPSQIRQSRDRLRVVAKYYWEHVGQKTYYPRIVSLLIKAMDHALANATIGS